MLTLHGMKVVLLASDSYSSNPPPDNFLTSGTSVADKGGSTAQTAAAIADGGIVSFSFTASATQTTGSTKQVNLEESKLTMPPLRIICLYGGVAAVAFGMGYVFGVWREVGNESINSNESTFQIDGERSFNNRSGLSERQGTEGKVGLHSDFSEIESLRNCLAEEKRMRIKLADTAFVPITFGIGLSITNNAKELLGLSEIESQSMQSIINEKLNEIGDREFENASLISDEKGDYFHIPPIPNANTDLDMFFDREFRRLLGDVRGETAFRMLKKDRNVYSGFETARDVFVTETDNDEGSSSYFLVIRYVDSGGNQIGEESEVVNRNTLPSRYEKLFDSLNR